MTRYEIFIDSILPHRITRIYTVEVSATNPHTGACENGESELLTTLQDADS
jgi:hypothetical protein